MTRHQTLAFLAQVNRSLGLEPDENLLIISWEANRVAYDTWLTWAVESIADWEKNIFLGYGSGDKKGQALDIPCTVSNWPEGKGFATTQLITCLKASIDLLSVFPTLREWFLKQFKAACDQKLVGEGIAQDWSTAASNVTVGDLNKLITAGESVLEGFAKKRPQPTQKIRVPPLDWSEDDSDFDPSCPDDEDH